MAYQDQVNTALGLPAEASAEQALEAIEATERGHASTGKQAGIDAGIATERERVAAIIAAAADKPHARGIADAAITTGLTAEQASAMIAAAPEMLTLEATAPADLERERQAFHNAYRADANQQAPVADTATGDQAASDPETALKAKWDTDANLRAEFNNDFDDYAAFERGMAAGKIRIVK